MKLITAVESFEQLQIAKSSGLDQVILGHYHFSRFGKLQTDELYQLAEAAISLEMTPIFEWDILMTEHVFKKTVQELAEMRIDLFPIIRVQDPGAVEYVLEHYPNVKIQLVLENGNHNLAGIQAWVDYVGHALDRIVLSTEIPNNTLAQYIQSLSVPVEYLILGRILLFYSPRSLLTPLEKANHSPSAMYWIEGIGESEESPHKGFPLLENRHGTFMFHIKDFYLLEHLSILKEMKLAVGRVDLRFNQNVFGILRSIAQVVSGELNEIESIQSLRDQYPTDTMRGFFHVNKSDVIFPKLKNVRLNRNNENFLGDIIESSKIGQYLVVQLRNPSRSLTVNDEVKIVSPEGEEKILQITKLMNSSMQECTSLAAPKLAIINFANGMVPKSMVYKL